MKISHVIVVTAFLALSAYIKGIHGCGGELSEPSGTILSDNYPDSYSRSSDCAWIITAPEGFHIRVDFNDLDLEHAVRCQYDALEIWGAGLEYQKLCSRRRKYPASVETTGTTLTIRFTSDDNYQRQGFNLTYEFISNEMNSCGAVITDPVTAGIIYSPSYPSRYDNNLDCYWSIHANPNQKIRLTIVEFDLEDHDWCRNDFLEIFDYKSESEVDLSRYCGEISAQVITSSSRNILIRLRTNDSTVRGGFQLRYRFVTDDETQTSD